MSIKATRYNDKIHLEIITDAPTPDVIGKDGKAILNSYLTNEQWNEFIKANGTNVSGAK